MQQSDLKPANEFAKKYGVKAVIYGAPGTGKTPIVNTAPRPVLMACEPGLLSMKGSNVPTWAAFETSKIDEFFKWLFNSKEANNFDTVAIDSTSQMCELYLIAAQKSNKHGLAAYGEMARSVMDHLRPLFYMQQKHTYLIAKQEIVTLQSIPVNRPYYPGKQLPIDIPHLYDVILRLAIHPVPGQGQVKAFRCIGSIDEVARDRTGMLAEFEPPNFSHIVQKAMS
jgi:hypothetical protein